jgi:hypothetical protein
MNPMAKEENCLQAYFEQQDDKEAASIVASVVALLSPNSERTEDSVDHYNSHKELNNILLTKEVIHVLFSFKYITNTLA